MNGKHIDIRSVLLSATARRCILCIVEQPLSLMYTVPEGQGDFLPSVCGQRSLYTRTREIFPGDCGCPSSGVVAWRRRLPSWVMPNLSAASATTLFVFIGKQTIRLPCYSASAHSAASVDDKRTPYRFAPLLSLVSAPDIQRRGRAGTLRFICIRVTERAVHTFLTLAVSSAMPSCHDSP